MNDMTIDKPEAEALAMLALAIRPHGARRWDGPGVVAVIAKVKHLSLADVAMATIRAAANPKLDSPGAIANTTSEVWRERVTPMTHPHPPRAEEMCPVHGGHIDGCHGCAADRLVGEATNAPDRPVPAAPPTDAYRAAREGVAR